MQTLILRSAQGARLEGWQHAPNLWPCFETPPSVAPHHEDLHG